MKSNGGDDVMKLPTADHSNYASNAEHRAHRPELVDKIQTVLKTRPRATSTRRADPQRTD